MKKIVFQDGANHANHEDSALSKLCMLLLENIISNKVIGERILFDFSKQVTTALGQSELPELPESFYILAERADEYCRYDAESDTNIRRAFSYSRVFQMTQMLHIHINETQKIEFIESSVNKNQNNFKLLSIIYKTPWITHKELSDKIGISPPALTRRIMILEQDGFVKSLRQGKRKHYFLTERGELLKAKLTQTIIINPPSTCSPIKAQLLYLFVDSIRNKQPENPLFTVNNFIDYLEQMDDLTVYRLWGMVQQRCREQAKPDIHLLSNPENTLYINLPNNEKESYNYGSEKFIETKDPSQCNSDSRQGNYAICWGDSNARNRQKKQNFIGKKEQAFVKGIN